MTNSNTGVNGAIGVVGLGNMGLGMVRTLLREGFAVIGFDLSDERQVEAARAGAEIVTSQKELFVAANGRPCHRGSDRRRGSGRI